MVRKLKFHEKKLLKKVDFISWEAGSKADELRTMRRFQLKNHEEYTAYNKLSRELRELARKIKCLNEKDPFRVEAAAQLISKAYAIGLIPTKHGLHLCDLVTASAFCRRRLASLLVKNKMAEHMSAAVRFIEHGHVRVGPEVVIDPAFLVPRAFEDYITWTDSSAVKKHVVEYNDLRDDFDMNF